MKLLLLPFLLLGAGAGWYGLGSSAETPASCDEGCRITVECLDGDTCLVTCTDPAGDIVCQQEVDCDGPCQGTCDEPCATPCPAPCPR